MDALTEDQGLQIARSLIAAQKAFPAAPARLQRPATVVSYDSTTATAMILVSGDTVPIQVVMLGGSATAGDGVMMSFEKPRGAFIGAGGGSTGVGPAGPPGADGAPGAPGSPGAPGAPGVDGKTVRNGHGAPSSGVGTDGDFYIDVDTDTIYGPKTAGAWGSGTSLRAPLNRSFAFFMAG